MEIGPELDALVAEKVMGWEAKILPAGHSLNPWTDKDVCVIKPVGGSRGSFQPSTDIKAAWEVVEKFLGEGKSWNVCLVPGRCWVSNHTSECIMLDGWTNEDDHILEAAPTAPLAICLAALKAVGLKWDDESGMWLDLTGEKARFK